MIFKRMLVIAVSLLCLNGCVSTGNNSLKSILWVQTASEYKANSIQTYHMAERVIDFAIKDENWTAALEQDGSFSSLPLAVAMDIDETVLDNSMYQAQLVMDGREYDSDTWDEWISMKRASAVPGAVDFIRKMKSKNIEVIFITNRECKARPGGLSACPQENDTIENLAEIGIQDVKPEHILLKNELPEWTSEKRTRRKAVASGYRVLMLIGDDLGDFLPDVKKNITRKQRDELVNKYENNWGIRWFMVSNPMYGSWMRVLEDPKSTYLKGYR